MLDLSRLETVRRRTLGRLLGTGAEPTEMRGGRARVVCVASGKGGTGKSVLATNLAALRAARGERVLLVDFDTGLANAHLLLGLAPRWDLGHVMEGTVPWQEALVHGPAGVDLLSGGVGRTVLANPTRRELERLFAALATVEAAYDLIVIDHGAGMGYGTIAHLAATTTLVLVTSHEVTGLSDAYALYKRALLVNPRIRVGVVVNQAPDERVSLSAWERFRSACRRFLVSEPEWIGWIPTDEAVVRSVEARRPVVLAEGHSAAARALRSVASWKPLEHASSSSAFYERAARTLR